MPKFSGNVINVKFSAGKGECQTRAREAVTGEPFGELPVAHRAGYTFEGWFTQPDENGDKVTSGDVVTAERDITLYARYSKQKGGQKKRSSYRLQKKVLIALVSIIALLAVTLVAVNYIVSIIPYVDEGDPSDESDDHVYRAKKKGGVYSIYDENGLELPKNDDGYYLAHSGTQLSLNPDTGAISEFAVVYVEGTEQVGGNSRILMFPQISQSNVARIEVKNSHGSYTFYTDENGNVQIKGFESDKVVIQYDKEKYVYLCVAAGYPLTTRRLDTDAVLKNGYAEYGLVPETRVDANGNEYDYVPAEYTITSKSGEKYTVLIGDAIVSDAGYYVKLAGEENKSVYVMGNTNYDASLLAPIEQMITPMITYPTTLTLCYYVEDFTVASYPDGNPEKPNVCVSFDYIDLLERENTMYSTEPYVPNVGGGYEYGGYRLSTNEISPILQALYDPNVTRICKLGITDEALEAYGLTSPAHMIYYDLNVDSDGNNVPDTAVTNTLFISEKTANGTYYVASDICDVIAEVDQSSLYFLEYETIDWVDANIFWINLAYLRSIEVSSPAYRSLITLDNSKTDQSKAISSTNIEFKINGVTPDYIVYKQSYASGKLSEENAVYNLRQFYKSLLSLSIIGNAADGPISLSKEQMEAFRAMDDSECQLVLTGKAEDLATVYNSKYHTKNNTSTLTYRFYRYSEGRSYLTINGEGEFFVDATFVEKLISDAQKLETGVLIDSTSKS